MVSLVLLLFVLILLPCLVTADETMNPTRVRYVPAPAEALTDSTSYVCAATADGRNLLIYGSELRLWDTQDHMQIPLVFSSQPEIMSETVESLTQYQFYQDSRNQFFTTSEEYQEALIEWTEGVNARIESILKRDNTSAIQTLEQLEKLFPGLIEFNVRDVNDHYAIIVSSIGTFSVDLLTGDCLFLTTGPAYAVALNKDHVFFYGSYEDNYSLFSVDLVKRQFQALDINDYDLSFRNFMARSDKRGKTWLMGYNGWYPTNDEELEAFRLNMIEIFSGNTWQISLPRAYWDRFLGVSSLDRSMITGDGNHVLLYSANMPVLFVMVDLTDGSSLWHDDTLSKSADSTLLKPISALENCFVCYRPSDECLVLLDPETGDATPLTFEMRSDDMPAQYRDAGSIGIHSGKVWTTITSRMLRNANGNSCGMVFGSMPGYLVLE